MATLKGQNFRVLLYNSTASKWSVIAMATNCSITLGTSTDESSTKDDTGMASKPEVVSKNWSVQVDSLDVSDVGAMLTAIKSSTKFQLLWDETSTTDNQTPAVADFARVGSAYIADATFTFDDRTNSAKSIQFQGVGGLGTAPSQPATAAATANSFTKGQYVRLFLSSDNTNAATSVVAAAKQMSLHVSVTLEQSSTKDTTGDWESQEPTAISYDISSNALMRSGETISSAVDGMAVADIMSIYEAGSPVKWKIANVGSANNRTASSTICSGSCIIQSLTLNGANRAVADYSASLIGWGDYTVGS